MSFCPPGVTPAADFGNGVHNACILVKFEQVNKPAAFNASVVYKAVYRDTESGAEVDDVIKFDGSKRDYYAGLRVERLHAIIGAELPPDDHHPDFKNLLDLSDGLFFTVEMSETQKDGKTYINIKDVRANEEAVV
jgi:hypothetical protein